MTRRRERARVSPFTILTVCIGNVCRSPLAEQLLRTHTEYDVRFEFAGAGLQTVDGIPMDELSAEQSVLYGGNPAGAKSSRLTDMHVDAADLVLTMTVGQRDELIQRHPRGLRRTFSIAEFAQLVDAALREVELHSPVTADDFRQVVDLASRIRGTIQLRPEDDIEDPISKPKLVHERVGRQINGYTEAIARALVKA